MQELPIQGCCGRVQNVKTKQKFNCSIYYGLGFILDVSFSRIELTPCGFSTTFVPSQRALSVKSEQSSLMSMLLALKCGCDVMLLHAVSTSTLFSLFSVGGKVAPLHMIMGPSAPAGAVKI